MGEFKMRVSRSFRMSAAGEFALATGATSCLLALWSFANAQELKSASELEAAAARKELKQYSAEPGEIGQKARDALKTLEEGSGSPARQMRSETGSTRVVNGITSVDYPASGALLHGSDARAAQILCSGTLISCKTFLTAAHCFIDPLDPTN